MNTIVKPNFLIFTGGPGSGKTAVLNELVKRGYRVVPEVARAIIKEQNATGGDATHNGNRVLYCDLMLKNSIRDYVNQSLSSEVVFFDRGIPDLYSYSKRFCDGVTPAIYEAVKNYRYNQQVFLFPAWPDIYCHDSERKQDFQEAIETYEAVKEGYTSCGYKMIEMPLSSIDARADFIIKTIELSV